MAVGKGNGIVKGSVNVLAPPRVRASRVCTLEVQLHCLLLKFLVSDWLERIIVQVVLRCNQKDGRIRTPLFDLILPLLDFVPGAAIRNGHTDEETVNYFIEVLPLCNQILIIRSVKEM